MSVYSGYYDVLRGISEEQPLEEESRKREPLTKRNARGLSASTKGLRVRIFFFANLRAL